MPSPGSAQESMTSPRIPRATYRLQFGSSFTFRDAEGLIPYLDDLGISDVYASPLTRTCHDDSHGYDICDGKRLPVRKVEKGTGIGLADAFSSFPVTLLEAVGE